VSEIDELRNTIANIDAEIVTLIGKRLETARQIGEYKRQNGLDVIVPDVEEAVIKRYLDKAHKIGVPKEVAEKIAVLLIATSRNAQE